MLVKLYRHLLKERFVHFFIIGAGGFLLNILITVFLTEFVFGKEKYLYAYIIGIAVNLVVIFLFHRQVTFKTKDKPAQRFFYFLLVNIAATFLNMALVKLITNTFGNQWYWFAICMVTGLIFCLNFILSKIFIFKKRS